VSRTAPPEPTRRPRAPICGRPPRSLPDRPCEHPSPSQLLIRRKYRAQRVERVLACRVARPALTHRARPQGLGRRSSPPRRAGRRRSSSRSMPPSESRRPDSNRGPLHYESVEKASSWVDLAWVWPARSGWIGSDLPSWGHGSGHVRTAIGARQKTTYSRASLLRDSVSKSSASKPRSNSFPKRAAS
jgi:hypothetical protein